MIRLRPYQSKAEDNTFKKWEEGYRSVVGRMFTGGGKTVTFASIIQRIKKRAMVIAHRQELIYQAKDKIEKVTGLKCDIEMGQFKSSNDGNLFHPKADVIISTIQTQTAGGDGMGRMSKFNPKDFGLLIVDEAHHATSQSYRRMMDWYLKNPELVILGVTATPKRSDEEALGQIFEEVCFDHDMNYGIKEGWLAPFDSQMVYINSLDLKSVRVSCGELNGADLSKVMESEKPLHGIAHSVIEIAGEKRGIGFSPSVEHARLMANIFNRHRSGMAAFVSGKIDKEERKKINLDFANGKINWIWNCGTHTEGFDDSGVEVIVPKPTKSDSLLEQMMGRGGRPHESIANQLGNSSVAALRRSMIFKSKKPSCLILEYYGNRYDLSTSIDILGGYSSEEAVKSAIEKARKSGNPMRVNKTIEEEEKIAEEKKKRELDEAARRANLVIKSNYSTKKFDVFTAFGIKPTPPRSWDVKKALTPKMIARLRQMGENPDEYTFGEAGQAIGENNRRYALKLANLKQCKWLKSHGYSTETKFVDAIQIMDAWKRNGWRRPPSNQLPASVTGGEKKIEVPREWESENVPF